MKENVKALSLVFVAGFLTVTSVATASETKAPKALPPHIQAVVDSHPNQVSRIMPFGSVCVEGGARCPVKASKVGGDPNAVMSGEDVYLEICASCHATGALGSPVYADKGAWGARIGKGTATLYTHALSGFNQMPAKGGADHLKEQEVKNAVDYMIAAVK